MYTLNQEQVLQIEQQIKGQEINYSHLSDDLLDHICCEIESKIDNGLDYKHAYSEVFDKIGVNGLKDIQEATIFYVKLNLKVMKKFMNLIAIIGGLVLIVGMLFKLWHIEGAGLLLFFGFILLLLGFFPVALLNLRKDMGVKFFSSKFLIYLVGFITFVETGAAMMFKLMHWPGGGKLVTLSMVLIFLVFFPYLFVKIIRTEQNRTVNLSLAIFSLFFIGFITVANINSARRITNVYAFEDLVQENNFYTKSIQSLLKDSNLLKGNMSVIIELNKELNHEIESYKTLILNNKKDIYELNVKMQHESLIDGAYDNRLISLKENIEKYRHEVLLQINDNNEMTDLVNNLLYTGEYQIGNFRKSWLERKFQRSNVEMYTSLQQLKKNINQIEYEILRLQLANKNAPEY